MTAEIAAEAADTTAATAAAAADATAAVAAKHALNVRDIARALGRTVQVERERDASACMRRHQASALAPVGCRLTVTKPVLKASMASALETILSYTAFHVCFELQLAPLHLAVATAAAADATAANTAGPLKSVAATDADVALVAAAAKRAIVVSEAVTTACAAATAADDAHAAAAAAALTWWGGAG